MPELVIRWQRLVDSEGRTCDRCGATGTSVEEAASKLRSMLRTTGLEVVLETEVLSESEFLQDTLESNRIWISGKPLEDWLRADSGSSACCSVCGDEECRTVTVGGVTYDAIPAELVVEAGLKAAAELLRVKSTGPCCQDGCSRGEGFDS